MKLRAIYVLLTLLVSVVEVRADVCRSTTTGDWNNAAVWDCGHEPACGDTVYVSPDHTVTVTDHVELDEDFGCNTPTFVVIQSNATLHFQAGKKMHLACNSGVTIENGGQITAGGGGGSSNLIDICNSTVWDAGDGDQSGPLTFGEPLPIELLFFNAISIEDHSEVMLVWQTASEMNNDYFTIERSKDGVNFEHLATVQGAGNSVQTLEYTLSDPDPYTGWSFYRLTQTDYDGKYEVFDPVAVNVKASGSFAVFPNPTEAKFTVQLETEQASDMEITICDASGRIAIRRTMYSQSGSNSYEFDSAQLPGGVYFVSISDEFSTTWDHFRLVVE